VKSRSRALAAVVVVEVVVAAEPRVAEHLRLPVAQRLLLLLP
jgi:hypothetical protein